MTRKITFIFLLFAFKFSAGQNIFISGDKNNVLFIGVENPITISVENLKPDDIVVKVDKGVLTGGYDKTYIYRGFEPGRVTISIYTKSDSKKIGRITFRAKYIPDPVVSLETSRGGIIHQSALKTLQYLRTELKDFDYDTPFSIDSFTVTIVHIDNCYTKEFFNAGNELKEELRNELLKMKKNDFVIFKQIYVKGPDARSRLLAPAVYTISE
jgi:GldM C-terminal domain